jgi:CRISPR-associated protein Csm1
MSSRLDSRDGVCAAERLALAASLQALFVFASRVAASSPATSRDGLLDSLAGVLPSCLSSAVRCAADPSALLESPQAPAAAACLDRGWALAVGESHKRLAAPGRVADAAWQWRLRVTPMIAALGRDQDEKLEEQASPEDVFVHPIGHPGGVRAAPIRLADELNREGGYAVAWNRLTAGASYLPPIDSLTDLKPWLWHFDSFLQEFLHAVPAYWEGLHDPGQSRNYSRDTLYDQSRLAGAIAVSLCRYAARGLSRERGESDPEPPLILISGEMDSIQDYILGSQAASHVDIADLTMRGRSSFLRLVVEIAAYRLCEDMLLPPGSIVVSAASKFTVLAPNTDECRETFRSLQIMFDQWALTELSGQTALSIAMTTCNESELETMCRRNGQWKRKIPNSGQGGLPGVLSKLARRAQDSRLHRFALCEMPHDNPQERPAWSPPIYLDARPTTDVADFQAHLARVLVTDTPRALLYDGRPRKRDPRTQSMPIFGYEVAITSRKPTEAQGTLPMHWDLRCWSGPAQVSSWRGRCRKPLAVYSSASVRSGAAGQRRFRQVLKGDIDHLSVAFQSRMPSPNLSRLAILSRELEDFFSIQIPGLLAKKFPDLVTILSGGDDFIYLGSSPDIMEFSLWLQSAFADYSQASLTLSAGASLPFVDGASIADAVGDADDALESAKETRNSIGFADISWSWPEWSALAARVRSLRSLVEQQILTKRTAVEIAELLRDSRTSPYLMVQIEDLLRAEAERYGEQIGDGHTPARALKGDAFQRLRAQLLFRPGTHGPEQVLVPLTLAYTTLS